MNAASATVTVTASSPTITYGDATPTIMASYSGLLGGDTSIADVTCSIEGYTGHAGTYTTECTGPNSTNDYSTITYATGTLTVKKAAQCRHVCLRCWHLRRFWKLLVTANSSGYTATANATSGTVTFSASSSGCSVDSTSGVITFSTTASCVIIGTVAASTNFAGASATLTITVIANTYTVTFAPGTGGVGSMSLRRMPRARTRH